MGRYDDLLERAAAGEPILIDGATGSECIHRGVPPAPNGWSGGAALTHPEIVKAIHADYLAIGADLIASNTFATGRNILIDTGAEADFERLNRQAVELALQARTEFGTGADGVVVAAGVSNWSFSGNRPSLDQLYDDTVRQATIMRDAGADLISLEMMVDLPRLEATLRAVSTVGLPVWVGFSVGPEEGHDVDELDDNIQLREGDLLADGVAFAVDFDVVDALCVMHTDVRLAERSVACVREHWDGPLGAYAHASAVVDGVWKHHDVVSPAEYVEYVPTWQAAGATMIGGCCGIGPAHLAEVAKVLW